jgi:rhamnosyltransferase
MMRISQENVCAVFVTYNPKILEFKENLNSVIKQVGKIIIVDNSTVEELQKEITSFHNENVDIISLGENKGITEAQDIGMAEAFKVYGAVILLDEDSFLPNGFLRGLCQAYNQLLHSNKKVACIGPVACDYNMKDHLEFHISENNNSLEITEIDQTFSSGSLISKEAYQVVGKRDDLFLDIFDFEWCWRAKAKGYLTYIVPEIKIPHQLGQGQICLWVMNMTISQPYRNYYQFRNILLMFKRTYVPLSYKIKKVISLPVEFVINVLFLDQKIKRLYFMTQGIVDGIKGVKGARFYNN